MEIRWGFQILYCTFSKMTLGPQKSNFLKFVVSGPIWIIFFFFDLEIRWGFQIRYCTLPKMTLGPQRSNFLNFVVSGPIWLFFSFFDLEIRWGFQIWYCTLPQMTHWTTKVKFLDILNFVFMNVVNLFIFKGIGHKKKVLWISNLNRISFTII